MMDVEETAGAGGSRPITYEATIESIVERAPQTRSFFLRLPAGQSLSFVPGQFISCLLPVGGEILTRAYSIASDPEQADVLDICFNLVAGGVGSHYMFGLSVGARLRFTGPWGTFTLERPPAAECVFIADGPGITPIRPMLRRALHAGGHHPVRLQYAAASARHVLYADDFDALARDHARFTFTPVLDGSLCARIERQYVLADGDRSRHFYICGVGEIVTRLRDLLRRAWYHRRAVRYEKW